MKILVTGGAGFIGFHTTLKLLERGDEVVIVDNVNPYYDPKLKEKRLEILQKNEKCTFIKADVSDYKAMENIFKEHSFDKVCHLAAQAGVRYSLEDPFSYETSNGMGTLNLLELCRHHGPKDFVFASSSSVYGGSTDMPFKETDPCDKPLAIYAATKKYNEAQAYAYHNLYGLNCTGLRFFTVYGPWGRPDMALFLFTKAMLNDEPINVFNNGEMVRDFTYVEDIVQGVIASIDKAHPYQIFNLARGETVKLLEFIEAIEDALGKKAQKNMMPMQQGDVPATSGDISKAKELLGYEPKTSVKEGVKNFVEWYKKHYHTDSKEE